MRPFALVMFVFYLALAGKKFVWGLAWWQNRFGGEKPSFTLNYLGDFILDLGIVASAVIVVLWLVKRRRTEFFLVKGRLDAPIEPVRWLGIKAGESWRAFGWIFAVAAGLGVFVPTVLLARPSSGAIAHAASLLPAVLLFAAINAFVEEVYFRCSLLATLPAAIGRTHALLLTSVFFGLAHYLYGSPPGVAGFMLTGFLAWLLGKSILETKGMLWAWTIHFVPDVVIFFSYALAWAGR